MDFLSYRTLLGRFMLAFTQNIPSTTLPESNSLPLKMDGWKMTFLLGNPIFRGELLVSGSVYIYSLVPSLRLGTNCQNHCGDCRPSQHPSALQWVKGRSTCCPWLSL